MTLLNAREALNEALLQYEAHVGAFMQTGAETSGLKARASAYLESQDPAVVAKAQAVVQSANGALAQFHEIQGSALQAAQKASTLKGQIDRDPQWQSLLSLNTGALGWRTIEALQERIGQVGTIASELAGLDSSMSRHLNSTMPGLRSDVQTLENIAQGKGFSGISHKLTAGITTSLSTSVEKLGSTLGLGKVGTYLSIGAVVMIFGPTFLQGTVAAFAPRPYRNPRRRRRLRRAR